MKSLSPTEAIELINSDDGVRIVDVREKWEYDIVRLPHSELMSLSNFQKHISNLNPEEIILVYCHQGVRSLSVCKYLESNGFINIINLSGGINAWTDEVDQNMPRY
ncbi:MAG: rhodanese-like domain-containing protein [Ignavibacteria bacterium]|nr:rhodanese-like domain-containing protein [Ignavibacteria bacterium]MDP3830744.1 rhodanese-like domain-containing protein [Ignavibacteriaceae bacterium]